MIFLIQYDRRTSKPVFMQRYEDSNRLRAQNDRIELEVEANKQGLAHEIVLLEADSEVTIRKTHARYFERVDSQETLERLLQEALPQPTH
jgi:hypothetical protein